MDQYSQKTFIQHWNKTAALLSRHPIFKNLPRLNAGFFSGGACCGLSFVLAEYVRLGRPHDFYKIYNKICLTDPKILADAIIRTNQNELVDFVYKVHIMQNQQQQFPYAVEQESDNESWAREICSAPNHSRIGSSLQKPREDYGEITDFTKLPRLIAKLVENESFEIGCYDDSGNSHSILVYKYEQKFHLFDSNSGHEITCANAEDIAAEVMLAANKNTTNGTNQYTTFDRLWASSTLFKILSCTLLFPIVFFWLLYDVFIASPLSDEKLKQGPLSNSLQLSWGRIRATQEPEITPTVVENKSNPRMPQPDLATPSYKENLYFGLGWLSTGDASAAISPTQVEVPSPSEEDLPICMVRNGQPQLV